MKTIKMLLFGMLGLLLAVNAFAAKQNNDKTVAQIAASNPNFSTLVTALKAANLVDTLNGKGPFTVFAPTNEAFAALPPGSLNKLLDNPDQLKKVLLYHVVAGNIKSNMIQPGQVKTLEGSGLNVSLSDGVVMINDAQVTKADIVASNGVIHVINKVLLPPKQ